MKKCFLIFVLLLLVACVPVLADTALKPGLDEFPKEDAIRIATEQLLKICGYEKESLTGFTVEADLWVGYSREDSTIPRRWRVILAYKENADLAFVVEVVSPSGEVFSTWPQDYVARLEAYKTEATEKARAIEQGNIWIAEKGPWEFWSYQDKAAFALAYGRDPNGFPEHDIGLPDDKEIPLERAISSAKTVIVREFGETAERLDQLKLDCTFLNRWLTASGAISRAWLIVFRGDYDENGIYPPMYQASVLSHNGEVDRIIQRDYKAEALGKENIKSWPPDPEPTTPPVTTEGDIFYNPDGGKYYHLDRKCPTVGEKYLPLTRLDRSELNEKPFSKLRPCPVCALSK